MCGIAGIVDLDGPSTVDLRRLARMSAAIAHRGPDGDGTHVGPGIGLAHRRLAIIDLDGGAQPMRRGRLVTVYNGELYNFRALRRELEALGEGFATRSDTEVVLAAYARWGVACLDRFNGMFAFAIWDEAAGTLFLARDRLGEKPLYWTREGGRLLFASEIDGLLAGLAATPPVDPRAVADFLALGYVPDPKSIYAGVHKLAPGHRLLVERGTAPAPGRVPAPVCWWRPRFGAPLQGSEDELTEELARRVAEAVTMRTVADVPLGAFLSGGVDSGAVVAALAAGGGDVVTCTVGVDDRALDESDAAAAAARHLGTRHVTRRVSLDAAELADRVPALYGEPFADPSALPTWVVSRAARESVTVALSGDGGDEVFAGYRRHLFHAREEAVKAVLPAGLRRAVLGPLARAYPQLDRAPRPLRAKATLSALAGDALDGLFRATATLPATELDGLLGPGLRRDLQGYHPRQVIADALAEVDADDPLSRCQYVDLVTWLPGRMLVKVDRASMAAGLEVRVPLLDHDLVEWALRIPPSLRLRHGRGKHLLRRAVAPALPPSHLDGPKKGFSVPMAAWLRGPLRQRIEALARSPALLGTGMVDPAAVAQLTAEHTSGRRDRTMSLWALMVLDGFLARAAGAAVPEAA